MKPYLELATVRITIAVSITTAAGFLLASGRILPLIIPVVAGIFLLACGSSVINHIQDFPFDSKMGRTKGRPLPAGKVSIGAAWRFALLLSVSGAVILYVTAGAVALGLGLLAMFWYNVIYGYLKRISPYAVIPGSLIGAIPPMIGWVSAGGAMNDSRMFVMALFFFIWQVPHFWLLMLKYGRQYETAGFPSLTSTKTDNQIFRMIYLWVVATFVVAAFLPFSGLVETMAMSVAIWLTGLYLLTVFTRHWWHRVNGISPGYYFMRINYFVLLTVVFLILDALIR